MSKATRVSLKRGSCTYDGFLTYKPDSVILGIFWDGFIQTLFLVIDSAHSYHLITNGIW